MLEEYLRGDQKAQTSPKYRNNIRWDGKPRTKLASVKRSTRRSRSTRRA